MSGSNRLNKTVLTTHRYIYILRADFDAGFRKLTMRHLSSLARTTEISSDTRTRPVQNCFVLRLHTIYDLYTACSRAHRQGPFFLRLLGQWLYSTPRRFGILEVYSACISRKKRKIYAFPLGDHVEISTRFLIQIFPSVPFDLYIRYNAAEWNFSAEIVQRSKEETHFPRRLLRFASSMMTFIVCPRAETENKSSKSGSERSLSRKKKI